LSTESFKRLVVQYSRQVLNTAARVLGDRQAAQDVHQEVFMAIWRRWGKFNGETNWQGYLYRTTVRKAMEYAKKQRSFSIEDRQITPRAAGEKPDSNLRALELQKKLSVQLSKLPDRQADVFVLSRIEGLTSEEIGTILGCSHETVRVHLHRAMKRLTVELSDYLVK
jgi:RNA polymerase sigma-70 factor (ECF subfamily)